MEEVKVSYNYDLDPRYGWIHVYSERESFDIVIQTPNGAFGYTFKNGSFEPYCVCHAYHEGECCCNTGNWLT